MNTIPGPDRTPLLICGAGPVGLTLALALATRGVRTVVLEAKPELDPHSRATLLTPHSLEVLAALGVLPAVVNQGQVNPALNILRAGDHRSLLRFDFAVAANQTAVPFAVAIPQDRTEQILLDAVLATGLVDVRFGTPLRTFTAIDDGVLAVTGPHGHAVQARYLVGADGAHRAVRAQLGWTLDGDTYPTRAFLADVRVASEADITAGWLSDPRATSFTLAVRFGGDADGGVWRLIESAIPDSVTQDSLDARARATTQRIFGTGAWRGTMWASAYRKHERRAATYRKGRVVLVGDAAHLHSPAGGQGLNTGLQDALALAWRLTFLIKGAGEEDALLNSYSAERTQAFDADVRPLTDGIERMETLPCWARSAAFSAISLLRRTRFPQVVARQLSMLTPTPVRSRLISGGDPAGRRLPDITVTGGRRLYDHIGANGLLLTRGKPADDATAPNIRVLQALALLPPPFSGATALLVRPDHLIGAAYDKYPSRNDIDTALGRAKLRS